ncbi:MAG: hypothetical protein ACU0AU_06970 [Cognatishimia activa]
MTMQRIGGLAALICAATYIFGFTLLVTVFAGSGFGTNEIDAAGVVRFTVDNQALMITWFTVIYVLNALALAVLVVALAGRLRDKSPDWGTMTMAFGLIWTTLVLGAGMIGNVTTETMAVLAPKDFETAVLTWEALHAVELGLGGGNEIAGGVWILCVSLAGMIYRALGKIVIGLGLLTGIGGLLTIFPPFGEIAGAVFGLGAIAWFIAVGVALLVNRDTVAVETTAS